MKKIFFAASMIFLTVSLAGCGKDPLEKYRDLTVQDYLNDLVLMREVLDKCSNHEIKGEDRYLCEVAKSANIRR